jgi:hypothetical protein
MFINYNNNNFTVEQAQLRERVVEYWMERAEYYVNLSYAYDNVSREKADAFFDKAHTYRAEAEQVAGLNPWQFNLYYEIKSEIEKGRKQ